MSSTPAGSLEMAPCGYALQPGALQQLPAARAGLLPAHQTVIATSVGSQGPGVPGKPQGKAAPMMAASHAASLDPAASFRQILPKDKCRVGQSPGSAARPTQVSIPTV
jgi:hypothetical protein